MRIAIVNDMRAAGEALRRVVESLPGHELAWTAADGVEAVAKARQNRPDLILMDLLMPHLDGAEATRQIMAATPCAILVVTATVSGNISLVYEAMGHGALDAVDTPILGPRGRARGEDRHDRQARGSVAAPAAAPAGDHGDTATGCRRCVDGRPQGALRVAPAPAPRLERGGHCDPTR